MFTLVKTLMTLRQVNQSDLVKATGVSRTALSRFLNGSTELRSDALLKVLNTLGTDLETIVKKDIQRALGDDSQLSLGEDIKFLLEQAPPITRKMLVDTVISTFRSEKDPDTKVRVARLKKYKESIRTVRRLAC